MKRGILIALKGRKSCMFFIRSNHANFLPCLLRGLATMLVMLFFMAPQTCTTTVELSSFLPSAKDSIVTLCRHHTFILILECNVTNSTQALEWNSSHFPSKTFDLESPQWVTHERSFTFLLLNKTTMYPYSYLSQLRVHTSNIDGFPFNVTCSADTNNTRTLSIVIAGMQI